MKKSLSFSGFTCLIVWIFLLFNFDANAQDEIIPNWINVAHGPFNLVEPPDVINPVLTPSDVTDVSAWLVADPFIFHEDNAWYMFFEVQSIVTDKKDIGLATSSDGLHWKYQKIVLSETKPLSYPLVLKSNGEYYMIPEANNWLQVRIYRANNFPYDWTYLTSIASGRPFSDPSIFHYNNKWWMFVSKPGHDTLYLYYSNDLLSGWTEHPMSPVIEGDASLARPGGRSFVFDTDRIIRIAQKCDVTYGEQVRAFEVDILTEEDYAEHEIFESPLLKKSGVGWNAWGMHQFDPWWTGKEWICAVDGISSAGWSIGIYIAKPMPNTYCVANKADLIAALNEAKDNGSDDVIKIQQGTYNGNFVYTSTESFGVTIEGGYTVGCASRVVDPTNTVLDAQNNGVVLALSAPDVFADFALDGLTLQNGGVIGHGGGLFSLTDGTVTLTNNIISHNNADGEGGGAYFPSGTVTLTNNTFSHNSASQGGGGAYFYCHAATLANNTISNNNANSYGGGVWFKIFSDDDISNIYNNIIWNNSAVNEGGDLYIENDANNNYLPSTVNLYNNDFDQNPGGIYIQIPFPIDPSNLNNVDPLFVDPDNGDFHLSENSPCKDAGTDAGVYVDFDGDSRPQGFGFDIGADEIVDVLTYVPVPPCKIVDTRNTSAGMISAGSQRDFFVCGSAALLSVQGGDPAGCPAPLGEPLAAHISMVAVNPTGKGNLKAFPKGAGSSAGLSVNYNAIDTNLANAGTIKTMPLVGNDITVASNYSSAHVTIQVLGYYYPDGDLLYTPVTPCKIVDTRNTTGGIISPSAPRDFYVFGDSGTIADQGGNSAGCPSPGGDPLAAHISMVAVDPTGKGNLKAFPVGASATAGLSINYNAIDTNLANAGTVKTTSGDGPDITVATRYQSAHVTIQVLGYYYPDGDLLYTPVTPCKIVDTRNTSAGMIGANTQRDFYVRGTAAMISAQGGDPDGCLAPLGEPLAAHISMVAVNPTGKGNLKAFPKLASSSAGLSVNYNAIDTNLANAGTVKTITGSGPDITVASNYSSAHVTIQVLGYYYPAP